MCCPIQHTIPVCMRLQPKTELCPSFPPPLDKYIPTCVKLQILKIQIYFILISMHGKVKHCVSFF